jgi:mono/diheme cytochrome c family protein
MAKVIAKKFLIFSFFLAITTLVLNACSAPEGNMENGKRWYLMHNCQACHGRQGDDGKGPVIYPLAMGFRHFKSIVRNANSPIMPKFPEEKISNQDVADIYTWLKMKSSNP